MHVTANQEDVLNHFYTHSTDVDLISLTLTAYTVLQVLLELAT